MCYEKFSIDLCVLKINKIKHNRTSTHFQFKEFLGLFRLCPPSLVGAYYLQLPDSRALFLHNHLLCNGTCAVIGGSKTWWGTQTEKIGIFVDSTKREGLPYYSPRPKLSGHINHSPPHCNYFMMGTIMGMTQNLGSAQLGSDTCKFRTKTFLSCTS